LKKLNQPVAAEQTAISTFSFVEPPKL